MYTHRLTFSIDAVDADTLYQLAQRYNIPLAEIVRESVRRLLDDLPAYEHELMQRLAQRYKLPTPEQVEAAQRLIADAMAVDLSALIAHATRPRDPAQSLHSARVVLSGTACVHSGLPEPQQ
jgi:hypothetical protein